jgi:hypothetical protein
MPSTLRTAALAAALAALPAIATAQTLAGRDDPVYTWRGALPARALLTIRNFNGPIDVRASDGTSAEVRAEKRAARGRGSLRDVAFHVRTSSSGDVTFCSTYRDHDPCDDENRWSDDSGDDHGMVTVAITVLVPRTAQLKVATGNGALTIDGVGADLQAATGNGRIRVSGTDGAVRATTGNGDVLIRDTRSRVHVTTGNGDVTVTTTEGPVQARSGNGDIVVSMSALKARDAMTFSTGSGEVRVTLPAGYSGELDATTGNGEIHSDFDLKLNGRITPRRIRATIGVGGPTLRLATGNGQLQIRKGQ